MDEMTLLNGEGLLNEQVKKKLLAFDLLANQPALSVAQLSKALTIEADEAKNLRQDLLATSMSAATRASLLESGLQTSVALRALQTHQTLPKEIQLPEGIWLSKGRISGRSELAVRGYLTRVAVAFSCDDGLFPISAQAIVADILEYFNLMLAPARQHLFSCYVSAALARSASGNSLPVDLSTQSVPPSSAQFVNDLRQQWVALHGQNPEREVAALILFALVLGEQLPEGTLLFADSALQRLDEPASRLGNAVYLALPEDVQSTSLRRAWGRENRRLHRYEWLMGSMTLPAVPGMMIEQAPSIWQAVQVGVVAAYWSGLAKPSALEHWREATFAALLPLIPLATLHAPIHAAFDLTTPYALVSLLCQQVASFSQLPVICTDHPDGHTQLLIRDRPGAVAEGARQLIWHLPPRPEDWAALAEEIVTLWGGISDENR